jgi:hypothetical protein
MKKSSLQEADYLVAWVVFFLCATVATAIVGFIAGAIISGAMHVIGANPSVLRSVAVFLLSLPVSYILFRLIVGKFIVDKLQTMLNNAPAVPQPQGYPTAAPQASNNAAQVPPPPSMAA